LDFANITVSCALLLAKIADTNTGIVARFKIRARLFILVSSQVRTYA